MTTYHISHSGNPHKLRTIKTVDTVEALNEANSNGQITLVRKIQRNPKLYAPRLLLRNYQSGQYKCVPSRSFHVRREGNLEFPEAEWELIQSYEDYHGKSRRNPDWAAYVIPVSPAVGERFYIEDVIEEIFIQGFWYSLIGVDDGEGIWNGTDIEINKERIKKTRIVG